MEGFYFIAHLQWYDDDMMIWHNKTHWFGRVRIKRCQIERNKISIKWMGHSMWHADIHASISASHSMQLRRKMAGELYMFCSFVEGRTGKRSSTTCCCGEKQTRVRRAIVLWRGNEIYSSVCALSLSAAFWPNGERIEPIENEHSLSLNTIYSHSTWVFSWCVKSTSVSNANRLR